MTDLGFREVLIHQHGDYSLSPHTAAASITSHQRQSAAALIPQAMGATGAGELLKQTAQAEYCTLTGKHINISLRISK